MRVVVVVVLLLALSTVVGDVVCFDAIITVDDVAVVMCFRCCC